MDKLIFDDLNLSADAKSFIATISIDLARTSEAGTIADLIFVCDLKLDEAKLLVDLAKEYIKED